MPLVRPGLGFAGFVYRRCYGYRSCVFQRFIRYLINRYLINTYFIHCLFRGHYNIMNRLRRVLRRLSLYHNK